MGDGERGGKGAAVHVKHHVISLAARRHMAQKERASMMMARDAEMLFARIELSGDKPKGLFAHRYISSFGVEHPQEVARPVAIVRLDYYGEFRSVAR
jgi:hypothetical protein